MQHKSFIARAKDSNKEFVSRVRERTANKLDTDSSELDNESLDPDYNPGEGNFQILHYGIHFRL